MSIQRLISRREILGGTVAAGVALNPILSATAADSGLNGAGEQSFSMTPVGFVEIRDGKASIRILEKYAPALKGLEEWSHVNVLYWFDRNDTPQKRSMLQVHPRGDASNPLTGVFACRAPVRPNLIALSVCKIKSVEGCVVGIESIDAMDGTPVLDLKPFAPVDAPANGVKVPAWAGNRTKGKD